MTTTTLTKEQKVSKLTFSMLKRINYTVNDLPNQPQHNRVKQTISSKSKEIAKLIARKINKMSEMELSLLLQDNYRIDMMVNSLVRIFVQRAYHYEVRPYWAA